MQNASEKMHQLGCRDNLKRRSSLGKQASLLQCYQSSRYKIFPSPNPNLPAHKRL